MQRVCMTVTLVALCEELRDVVNAAVVSQYPSGTTGVCVAVYKCEHPRCPGGHQPPLCMMPVTLLCPAVPACCGRPQGAVIHTFAIHTSTRQKRQPAEAPAGGLQQRRYASTWQQSKNLHSFLVSSLGVFHRYPCIFPIVCSPDSLQRQARRTTQDIALYPAFSVSLSVTGIENHITQE